MAKRNYKQAQKRRDFNKRKRERLETAKENIELKKSLLEEDYFEEKERSGLGRPISNAKIAEINDYRTSLGQSRLPAQNLRYVSYISRFLKEQGFGAVIDTATTFFLDYNLMTDYRARQLNGMEYNQAKSVMKNILDKHQTRIDEFGKRQTSKSLREVLNNPDLENDDARYNELHMINVWYGIKSPDEIRTNLSYYFGYEITQKFVTTITSDVGYFI